MSEITNIRGLVREIARREGRKSQAKVGDIREIISILSDLCFEDVIVISLILENGEKRARKRGDVK